LLLFAVFANEKLAIEQVRATSPSTAIIEQIGDYCF
jgi:hypothetical protein